MCPRTDDAADDAQAPDWDFAQDELALGGSLDALYAKDKDAALRAQREHYERALAERSSGGDGGVREEDAAFLSDADHVRLHREMVELSGLLREGNDLCRAIAPLISFKAALRLSERALCNPRTKGADAYELAAMVCHEQQNTRRYRSMSRFSKYVDHLRECYAQAQEGVQTESPSETLFAGNQELIGVATLSLATIKHGSTGDVRLAIVNQEGRVCGSLLIKLTIEPRLEEHPEATRIMSPTVTNPNNLRVGDTLRLIIHFLEAADLPASRSRRVYVRYLCPPNSNSEKLVMPEEGIESSDKTRVVFQANSEHLFSLKLTQELFQVLAQQPLAFRVYGHSSAISSEAAPHDLVTPAARERAFSVMPSSQTAPRVERQMQHFKIAERWARHVSWFQALFSVLEIGEQGVYTPVYGKQRADIACGPILRLRQGCARQIKFKLVHDTGARLSFTTIKRVSIGDIFTRSKEKDKEEQAEDSFREADLEVVLEHYRAMLKTRAEEIDAELRPYMDTESTRVLTVAEAEQKNKWRGEWNQNTMERDAMFQVRPPLCMHMYMYTLCVSFFMLILPLSLLQALFLHHLSSLPVAYVLTWRRPIACSRQRSSRGARVWRAAPQL